jgi:hypothetical protein
MTATPKERSIQHVPMLSCPRCGIRQYAAVAYVEEPRCVGCESPLDLRRLRRAAVDHVIRARDTPRRGGRRSAIRRAEAA